jgi:hypothetical protein
MTQQTENHPARLLFDLLLSGYPGLPGGLVQVERALLF